MSEREKGAAGRESTEADVRRVCAGGHVYELPGLMRSLVSADPTGAYDLLSPYLSAAALDQAGGPGVAQGILGFFGAYRTSTGKAWPIPEIPIALERDERWVRRALELRLDPRVESSARQLLRSLRAVDLGAAMQRWPDRPGPPERPNDGPRDILERYRAGRHEEVWRDLVRAGSAMDDGMREEAWAVAVVTMRRVRAAVEAITERLLAIGYLFDGFSPAWSPPAPDVEAQIAAIEHAVGGPCPLSLEAFWTIVGQVYWKHSEETELDDPPWGAVPIEQCDPLCVDDPGTAWSSCVEDWIARREDEHPEGVGPLEVCLAPDVLHKANISGGPPYSIRLPNGAPDALFDHEAHRLPFVAYLRLCIRWGGFPQLANYPSPGITELVASLCRDLEPF
jgi:hypothetical protein